MARAAPPQADAVAALWRYHRLSSLDPSAPAAAPERLVRATEPNPFRQFAGARRLPLPRATRPGPTRAELRRHGPAALDAGSLGGALDDAFGLVGWRCRGGARFGLRTCPSAGNRQPTEAHVLAGPIPGLGGPTAIWHYDVFEHALELRCELPADLWRSLDPGAGSFLVLLSTLPWRSAWKYGERALRLTQLDAGHACAALAAAAAGRGWSVGWLDALDRDLEAVLGPTGQGADAESALALLAVAPTPAAARRPSWRPDNAQRRRWQGLERHGRASTVSAGHRPWPGIDEGLAASRRRQGDPPTAPAPSMAGVGDTDWPVTTAVIRQRRSHQRFDPAARLTTRALRRLLVLAGGAGPTALPFRPSVQLLVFAHRVDGLEPGLHLWRRGADDDGLRRSLRPDLAWRPSVDESPELALLAPGDARRGLTHLAGDQAAAGDSLFTAALLAPVGRSLADEGPWAYRRLHWEAGEIGHRLYLAATAEGLAATGLSGFWDQRFHAFLGLAEDDSPDAWRLLYLTAVGAAAEPAAPLEPPDHRGRGAAPVPASRGGYRLKPPA